jgi:hypothetical protein
MFFSSFREILECFGKKEGDQVNFVFMGDSRMHNLYEYFEFLLEGNFTPWEEKPHHNLNIFYPEYNFKMDFLWGPQMETSNQKVFGFAKLSIMLFKILP